MNENTPLRSRASSVRPVRTIAAVVAAAALATVAFAAASTASAAETPAYQVAREHLADNATGYIDVLSSGHY